jgi:hypothetical protein
MEDVKIRRLRWAGHITTMEDERIQKRFLMESFIIQDEWENQEQNGSSSSGGTYHKS